MSQFKTVVLAVVAAAGITTAVFQHLAAERLRAENRSLRDQSAQLGELQQENARLSSLLAQAERPRLSGEQLSELLKLRGEVGRLRKDLAAGRAAGSNGNPTGAKNDAADDPAQPFTAAVTASLGDGQTLVTGGWTTAAGKRSFVLMTPTIIPAEPSPAQPGADLGPGGTPKANVKVASSTVEIPEAMLAQFGLDQLKADGHDSSVQTVLTAAEAGTLLKVLNAPPDGVKVTCGFVTVPDGMEVRMSDTPNATPTGQPERFTFNFGLTPTLAADQKTVSLSINAQVGRPSGP